MTRELVAINGQIFEPAQAKISVFDRGFLYGDSVYEVARSYDRVLFALEDHTARLFSSAEKIHMPLKRTPAEMDKEIYRVFNTAGISNAYVRVVITRGDGPIVFDPEAFTKPNTIIYVKELPAKDKALYDRGMDVIVASVLRNSKKSLDPNAKSGNYLNNVLAMAEAREKKAHDAVLVNRDGQITEGTLWNVFMVKGETIITPPNEADMLHGITRKWLKKISNENGMKWEERFFTPAEMKKADEAFATGTVKEVMAIRSLDGAVIGKGEPGPVTKKLSALYDQAVKTYCENFKGV